MQVGLLAIHGRVFLNCCLCTSSAALLLLQPFRQCVHAFARAGAVGCTRCHREHFPHGSHTATHTGSANAGNLRFLRGWMCLVYLGGMLLARTEHRAPGFAQGALVSNQKRSFSLDVDSSSYCITTESARPLCGAEAYNQSTSACHDSKAG